jgi:hypothetical protein
VRNYIVLDGKWYKTPAKSWNPVTNKPGTVRATLLGSVDVTFGSAAIREMQGQIEALAQAHLPPNNWGTIQDLRTTLEKCQSVPFTDHLEDDYEVVLIGPFKEDSFTSLWDSAENTFKVSVRIIKVRKL